jgi:copper resistance protein B
MRRLLIALLAASVATSAAAQHAGHTMPMPAPKQKAKPAPKPAAKAAPGKAPAKAAPAAKAKTKAAAKPVARPRPKPAARPASRAAPPVADPHAGHTMAPAAPPATDPHAGHDMGATGAAPPAPPVAPPPAAALTGPADAADAVYGAEAMADARDRLRDEHGDVMAYKILIDRLEMKVRDGRDGYAWSGQAWYGGDIDKLRIKSQGEGRFGGGVERAEVQALFSHAVDPWFDLQAGVRYDLRPDPERGHLVLGVHGLAPYWFEVDGALFLSDKGDLTARFEAAYDQRLTRKLILQPRIEFDLAAQDVPELGIGSGLSTAETGLRLRYEFVPEFAPYIGIEYQRAFGGTAGFARAAGEDAGGWNLLVGVRAWF